MAEARETRVFYKAISDFSAVKKDLRSVEQQLAKTQAAEKAFNASGVKDRAAATRASNTRAKSLAKESAQLKLIIRNLSIYRDRQTSVTKAVVAANTAIKVQNNSLLTNAKRLSAAALAAKEYAAAQRSISKATGVSSDAIRTQKELNKAQAEGVKSSKKKVEALKEETKAVDDANTSHIKFRNGIGLVNTKTGEVVKSIEEGAKKLPLWSRAFDNARKSMVRFRGDGKTLPPVLSRVERGSKSLWNSMEKFGNWRPRLVPPFVALIPIIGAVVAAINPLVALLGSLGGVAIGLAGQIGSLAGAFVALPGILAAVASGIGSVIASMGGVGNVFKTYSAMQKALGKSPGSSSGQSQEERAEKLADAERNLAKAQKNVTRAQEGLNKAREQALQDLIDLRVEVSRAGLNEERAIANLRQAQEEYWNVMADPGSTLGDKLDAAADIKEAEADLEDVRKKNIQNQNDLTAAEKKGVEQSDKVVDAQENLADALEAQRDAQRALKAESSGGQAAVQALNDYNEALAALSPSAKKFVLAIIGMQDQWKDFQKDIQETFFSQWVDELDRLPSLLRTLTSFLKPAAAAMGDFAGNLIRMLDSPAWKSDIQSIGESNGRVIENLGNAFLSLSGFLKDVVVAAGPFTEWLTGGLAEGADNMSKLLDNEDERGSFREWLEKVEVRLQRWWQVVKNIGATIFNFSAAASGFGDWITDNLLEMTQNWKEFSEDAKDPNSGFRKWLEDIKPVLSAANGLLGAFFSWFAEESADPENLQSMVSILKILTDDVGPALGRLLDTLAKTDIDEKFLNALTSIIESVDTIMESGGSAAFETFFDVVEGFFSILADTLSKIPKPILDGILSLFGLLAGITFIGKFTGLTNLIGVMLGFSTAKATLWTGLITGFKDLDKLKFAKLIGAGGLLAVVATLAVAMGNSNQKSDAWADRQKDAITDPTKENIEEANNSSVKDGNLLKNLGNIPGTSLNLMGMPGNLLGTVAELLHGWDSFSAGVNDFFGTSFATNFGIEFDNFLEDVTTGLVTWAETDLPKWWSDVSGGFSDFWNGLGEGWNNFWGDVGRNWESFSVTFTSGWNTFWGGLGTGVQSAVDSISLIWAGIQNAFRGPANWVIGNVWNNGIRKFWNDTAGKLGLGQLPEAGLIPEAVTPRIGGGGGRAALKMATGGVLPGYTPGRDVHTFTSSTGGTLKLSGGEAVMRPEFTKMVGGKKGVDRLNKDAREGHFARGGLIGDWAVPPGAHSVGSTGTSSAPVVKRNADTGGDLFSGLGGLVGKLFSDPVGYVGSGLKNLVDPLLAGMSNDGWSGLMKAVPGKLIDGMVNSVKTWFSANPTGGGAPSNAMGWQNQWSIIKGAFPWASLNSAYRPGAKTVNGGTSYHSSGRAIDVTPSMEIFNWIRQNYPNSRELIYSPAGGRQLQNGQNYFWGEPVRSQHWNHVHWAMKNGGVFPGLYDNGGWLPHGGMAVNQSGKPEAVLTNDESRALKSLLGGSGLIGRSALGTATPATVAGASGTQILDYSVNVENLHLHNPVPEKPSTSMAKGIRQMAYMNEARASAGTGK